MGTMGYRTSIDNSQICSRLAIVSAHLATHGEIHRFLEIEFPDSSVEFLSCSVSFLCGRQFHCAHLLCSHAQDFLGGFVEVGKPSLVFEIHKATADCESRGHLTSALARIAEAPLIDSLLA